MNPSWIEPPPPSRGGLGCFGKGCLILIAFGIFLIIAFVGGTFFAVRLLRTSYFPTSSIQLPANMATDQEQQEARAKWLDFERAARAHTARRIEMTADEINALIAAEPDLRGKAYVTIDNDTARLAVSIVLDDLKLLRGHYLNAECIVKSAPDGDPAQAPIKSIMINGKAVGDDALTWRGPWGFRKYIEQWTEKNDIKTFQIADGKVILESRPAE